MGSCGHQNLNRFDQNQVLSSNSLKHTTQTEVGLPMLWVSDVMDMKWQTFAGKTKVLTQ